MQFKKSVKIKLILACFFITAISVKSFAQWPGYFYAFELKDSDGNIIDSNNTNYKMTTLPCCTAIVMSINICEGNKTWHFYAGGNANLDKTNSLKIEKMENGIPVETMTIDFPATLSGGKEKFYRDLYAGEIKFKKGKRKIKLPKTDDEWDSLKELKEKICRLSYAVSLYYDISEFQK